MQHWSLTPLLHGARRATRPAGPAPSPSRRRRSRRPAASAR